MVSQPAAVEKNEAKRSSAPSGAVARKIRAHLVRSEDAFFVIGSSTDPVQVLDFPPCFVPAVLSWR